MAVSPRGGDPFRPQGRIVTVRGIVTPAVVTALSLAIIRLGGVPEPRANQRGRKKYLLAGGYGKGVFALNRRDSEKTVPFLPPLEETVLSRSSHPDTLGSETEDGGRPRSHHGKWKVKGSRVLLTTARAAQLMGPSTAPPALRFSCMCFTGVPATYRPRALRDTRTPSHDEYSSIWCPKTKQ